MAVYLTGDMHGSNDIRKLGKKHFVSDGLTRDDYLIILGDFGLVWNDPPTNDETHWLDWLEERPWTTLFIDGNHENHVLLDSLPAKQWHGGRVHVVRDHVLHLTRGQIFDIDDKTFFCMGGAYSTDKEWRTPGESWWEEEVPSNQDRMCALSALDEADWKVDYVLTHCPPPSALYNILDEKDHALVEADEYMEWLEKIAKNLDFTRWFYGHMHVDFPNTKPFTALYNDIVELLANGETRKTKVRKPLYMPDPKYPWGYSIKEIADYEECSFEEADQAVNEALRGQTVGLHPETGEILVYINDIRKVLRYLDEKLARG